MKNNAIRTIRSEEITIDVRICAALAANRGSGEVYLAAIAPDMPGSKHSLRGASYLPITTGCLSSVGAAAKAEIEQSEKTITTAIQSASNLFFKVILSHLLFVKHHTCIRGIG